MRKKVIQDYGARELKRLKEERMDIDLNDIQVQKTLKSKHTSSHSTD